MDPVSTFATVVHHSLDAEHSNCGAMRRDVNNKVTVPEAGSNVRVRGRDGPSPLDAIEAASCIGAGLLILRDMISLLL